MVQQVEIAERTLGGLADHQHSTAPPANHRQPAHSPSGAATADAAATNTAATNTASTNTAAEHVKVTPDIFDELLELVVDEDIKAAIS
jgi:hypothetical protein